MSAPGDSAPPEHVRRIAASAWKFRWQVELEAEARFARLAERLRQIGASPSMADLARRAALDERRHARLCAQLAESYGESIPIAAPPELAEIAPSGLKLRGKVLYEIVAACCITETESMGVLTTLLGGTGAAGAAGTARGSTVRQVLRELAEDEVGHSRLGWAHLASEHAQGATSFLGPLVPSMLEGSIDADLFAPVSPEREDEALLLHGVLPHGLKREVFARTLEEVVFPGMDGLGVDTGPARAWLDGKRQALAFCASRSA
ncbi:MAG: hypothetical protein A2V77_09590 [Anaeromyxobacter sp. RBG_16_69_14]|nr:MAG: hypothetical protein A2V77_09590 [Anaeromyxobacter sp. RBG_16_69_14]